MATKKTSGKTKAASKSASKPVSKPAVTGAASQKQAVPAPARETQPALRPDAELATREVHSPVIREEGELALKESAVPATVETPSAAAGPAPAAQAVTRAPAAGKGMRREISPRPKPQGNPYKPMPATVAEVIQETGNIKTLRVILDDAEAMRSFSYEPGQVGQLSVFGAGESTFVINSPPSQKDYLQFSVMQAGEVTAAIHRLSPGDKVGVRAPLGNYFPYESWKGKDVFFVGGGIGMAPIRTIMLHLLERKADYGKISLLYGARTPRDMAFSYELDDWLRRPDLDCTLCIDAPSEGWEHKVGLIPNVLLELNPDPSNCVAVLCGPPIMIKFTVQALEKLHFAPENIVTTLEKRMKCGIGICGRCNIGGRYVCVDGPVFTWKELQELPPEL